MNHYCKVISLKYMIFKQFKSIFIRFFCTFAHTHEHIIFPTTGTSQHGWLLIDGALNFVPLFSILSTAPWWRWGWAELNACNEDTKQSGKGWKKQKKKRKRFPLVEVIPINLVWFVHTFFRSFRCLPSLMVVAVCLLLFFLFWSLFLTHSADLFHPFINENGARVFYSV